jgi:hypothetical protein
MPRSADLCAGTGSLGPRLTDNPFDECRCLTDHLAARIGKYKITRPPSADPLKSIGRFASARLSAGELLNCLARSKTVSKKGLRGALASGHSINSRANPCARSARVLLELRIWQSVSSWASRPQRRKDALPFCPTYPPLAILWREEPELRRATMVQGCLFGIIGAVGVLFAPIAGKIADRRGPHTIVGLGSVIMFMSWNVRASHTILVRCLNKGFLAGLSALWQPVTVGSAVAGRSAEIGFSPIRLHAPFLRSGNISPQPRQLLTTTWFGTSIRMVLVQTPARFPRRTLRQREIRSVGRQKARATRRSRGGTARRTRRYRHCVPAIHFRRAFITVHCDDLPSIKDAIRGVWVRPGC